MQNTLVHCHNQEMFDAVVREMTDWLTDFIVRPQAFELIFPQSSIYGVRYHLKARNINTELLTFYTTEEEDN